MSRALSFMADPALAASVLPAPGTGFHIAAFLHEAGTLYMIAEAVSQEAPVAPLFAAMASGSGSTYSAWLVNRSLPVFDAGVPLLDVQEATSHADPRTTIRDMTGPAGAWTGTLPTLPPPTSSAPPGNPYRGIRHDGAAADSCRSLGRAPSPVPGGSGNTRAPHRTGEPCTHR